jgi:UDPglucose 6-dehydrogenase
MNIGFVGLGKLGLPCAMAIEHCGHAVRGYDISPEVTKILDTGVLPYVEKVAFRLLIDTDIEIVSVKELVEFADIIFVAVQTPHEKQFEGITRLTSARRDFDYSYLKGAVHTVSLEAHSQKKQITVVIISTVLPGTLRREIIPNLHEEVSLCYNPFFIAMGTTIPDFMNPEFVLFGSDDIDGEVVKQVKKLYGTIHSKPFVSMSIESAELTKVTYNTYITAKINIANTVMEICHKIPGADVDEVTNALKHATDRILGPKYMRGGMGDGGGCHPRDNIALSWLAQELTLSRDIYTDLMLAREMQTDWLATMVIREQQRTGYNVVILGKAFKPETRLMDGSPAILLKNIIEERGLNVDMYDPYIDPGTRPFTFVPYVFFIGTQHEQFKTFPFFSGSVVIDPFRYIPKRDDIKVIHIGGKDG